MKTIKTLLLVTLVSGIILGCKKSEEIPLPPPPNVGSQLTLEGKDGTSAFANVVYVDLSAAKATSVNRKSWNIAVSNHTLNKVLLNASYQSTAVETDKTNLADINENNPGTTVNLDHDVSDPNTVGLVDHWDGGLSKTAYKGEVPEDNTKSKVYLYSYEGNKAKSEWIKFKVTRINNGYEVTYGKINDTQFRTIRVSKDLNYMLTFISFDTHQIVKVEPELGKWDIAWGYSTNNSGLGSPYWIQDFVWSNSLFGIRVAEVLTSDVTFDDFSRLHLSGYSLSTFRDNIGVKWRSTQPATGVKTDRFYLIQDNDGNIYKLKFVSMGVGGDGGERGRPVIEYKLVL